MKKLLILSSILLISACSQEKTADIAQEESLGSLAKLNAEEVASLKSESVSLRLIDKKISLYHIEGIRAEDLNQKLNSDKAVQNIELDFGKPIEPLTLENLQEANETQQAATLPTCVAGNEPLAIINTSDRPYRIAHKVDLGNDRSIEFNGNQTLNAGTATLRRQALSSGASLTLSKKGDPIQEAFLRSQVRLEGNTNLAPSLELYWYLQASGFSPILVKQNTFKLEMPVVGQYVLTLIAYDRLTKTCSTDSSFVKATANPEPTAIVNANLSLREGVAEQYFPHLVRSNALEARKKLSGKGVRIAILDSGLNYNHPSLRPNILINENEIPNNGIDDDNNGYVDDIVGYDFENRDGYAFDDAGHGSHVAGIAAAVDIGVANQASLIPVKTRTLVNFVESAAYIIAAKADIVNISLGFRDRLPPQARALVRDMLKSLEEADVLIVQASGNDTMDITQTNMVPMNMQTKNMIVVGAIDENDRLTEYSNYSKTAVHIAAYGGSRQIPIVSVALTNEIGRPFVGQSGTSMAAPFVAGAAAMVLEANPDLSAPEVVQVLKATSSKNPALRNSIQNGNQVNLDGIVSNLALETNLP